MVSVDVLSPTPLSSAKLDAHTFDSINSFTNDSATTSFTGEQEKPGIKITITGCKDGLGIRIVDAINILKQACGIFVKEVIAGSLAEMDGQLRVGDQLLEVNGINLIGVSRENCRKIMEGCTATNQLTLLVARDHQSRENFQRLSVSLGNVINPSVMYNGNGQMTDYRFSTISTMTNDTARKSTGSTISSASLTQVSDISDEPKTTVKTNTTGSSQTSVKDTTASGQISTTDVIVEVASDTDGSRLSPLLIPPTTRKSASSSEDDSPPPLPSSEPPALDEDTFKFQSEDLVMPKKRVPTNAEAVMASAGSSIAAIAANKKHSTEEHSSEHEIISTVTIAKQSALGLTIRGGTNKPEGPFVYIDRVIAGLDVANDGTLRSGDRLIAVNGESMEGITKEQALRILTQLKLRPNTKEYEIVYGRKDNKMLSSALQTPARKNQPVTPSTIGQPTVVYNSSIFDSATESTVNVASTSTTIPNDTTTLTSLMSSRVNTAKFSPTLMPATAAGDDDIDWHSKDENDQDVVMRDKTTKPDSYKRLTMDPRKKVAFNKLIMAMEYMGRKVSESEQEIMRQSLGIEPGGKVVFQDFADLVKDMFKFKLDMAMMEPTLMGSIERKDSIEMPPLRKTSSSRRTSSDFSYTQREDSPKPELHVHSKDQDAELERMRQLLHQEGQRREEERSRQQQMLMSQDAANQQALLRMQAALQEKEQQCKLLESQVEHLKKQAEIVESEARHNKSRLEQNLHNKLLMEYSKLPKDVEELRKRLAVLDCELRKEQNTSRRYQVTTERLIQLAESVQESLVGGSDKTGGILYHPRGTPARRGDPIAGNPRPPHYLSKHSRHTNTTLARDVKETLTAVKNLLDHQPMPHGWEESCTDEGVKFYINHEKQITSWVNPVTQVFAGASQSSRSSSRTTSMTTSHVSITMPPQQ